MICNKAECKWNGNGSKCNNTLIIQLLDKDFKCYNGLALKEKEDGKIIKIDKRII